MSRIRINRFRPLEQQESQYVKPMRVFYDQNGKERSWDCIKVHDSVSVVLYNVSRSVLVFVKQFRPAVLLAASLTGPSSSTLTETKTSGYTVELCAGIMDKDGKSPAETAVEEILEETGYKVDVESLQFISSFRSGVGVSGSLQHLYFCEVRDDQRVTAGGGDEMECIEVLDLNMEAARSLVWTRDEDCSESRPAAMLFALTWFFYVHQKH